MKAARRQRVALFSILLIVGVGIGASIVALGAEKAIPGTRNEYVSVVKAPPAPVGQFSEQQSELQTHYAIRLTSLMAIANNDDRGQQLLADPRSHVVGIALPSNPGAGETDALLLRIDNTFYKITIDKAHEKVRAVEERTCYGPGCNQ